MPVSAPRKQAALRRQRHGFARFDDPGPISAHADIDGFVGFQREFAIAIKRQYARALDRKFFAEGNFSYLTNVHGLK